MKTSEEVKAIIPALLKVQEAVKGLVPDARNPHFRNDYITLDSILADVRPKLTKEGLLLMQEVHGDGELAEITTTIYHKSGEYIKTETLRLRPTKNNPQQMGSAITYGKRYQLSSLLGISTEVDDDGNKASQDSSDKVARVLSDAQIKRFYTLARIADVSESDARRTVKIKYGVEPVQMTRRQYDEVCKSLEEKQTNK